MILKHFITFTNTNYMSPDRILNEAKSFGFDSIQCLSELDIPQFIEKHRHFIQSNGGFGCFIWKPKIILDKLNSIEDGDILIYCDAGIHLNSKGIARYNEYLDILKDKDMLNFSLNDCYTAQGWVKRDAIDSYYPEFIGQKNRYCYAGLMMLKKTKYTISLIEDWLGLCEKYNFIDQSPSSKPEYPGFGGQDFDNGLFNLCLAKHSISHYVYPDETNIYLPNGIQDYNANPESWKQLDSFPFQCRRIRPGNPYYQYYLNGNI